MNVTVSTSDSGFYFLSKQILKILFSLVKKVHNKAEKKLILLYETGKKQKEKNN